MVADATRELDELEATCQLLRQFRAGQITLAELKRRTTPPTPDRDELELIEALMLAENGTVAGANAGRWPRARTTWRPPAAAPQIAS